MRVLTQPHGVQRRHPQVGDAQPQAILARSLLLQIAQREKRDHIPVRRRAAHLQLAGDFGDTKRQMLRRKTAQDRQAPLQRLRVPRIAQVGDRPNRVFRDHRRAWAPSRHQHLAATAWLSQHPAATNFETVCGSFSPSRPQQHGIPVAACPVIRSDQNRIVPIQTKMFRLKQSYTCMDLHGVLGESQRHSRGAQPHSPRLVLQAADRWSLINE